MSDLTISVGTELHVVLGEPATYDLAGFAALTYVEVGDVGNIPAFGGQAQVAEFIPLKTGVVEKRPGSINYGSIALSIANIFADTGQLLLKSGFDGANRGLVYSVKIINPNFGVIYFTAVITSFQPNIGDANQITGLEVTLEVINELVTNASVVTVTYQAGANGSVYGELSQTLMIGNSTAPVYAAPVALYEFSQWNDASTDNPRTDVAATTITYTASFVLI